MTRTQSNDRVSEERVAMGGHTEARARLKDLGWSDAEVGTLEDAVDGYADFARCVAGEVRWDRRDD